MTNLVRLYEKMDFYFSFKSTWTQKCHVSAHL